MLVQLEDGSDEITLLGNMAESIVLKTEWISRESYLKPWITTAWIGLDPLR